MTTIGEFVDEDMRTHGCLLMMKDALASVSDSKRLEPIEVALLYAHDFAKKRKIGDDLALTMSLINTPPKTPEIKEIVSKRVSEASFHCIELFVTGEENLTTKVNEMRSALLI